MPPSPPSELHDTLVAPSPIVPTSRSSSQLFRRTNSSMPALSAGDTPSPMPSDGQMKREAVPELVQLFQAQSASSATQGNGARDIFKAGHRRLRQLAQRQKKISDPRAKAEEASRQLLALQEEGFLPVAKTKKTDPKISIDSTISSSQSASNLSYKSTSRRDVESIGQPWLGDPLDRLHSHEPMGTQLSSLDLRDLTSFVEAAVSLPLQLDDVTPPPYQPSPHPNPASENQTSEKPAAVEAPQKPANSDKQTLGQTEDVPSPAKLSGEASRDGSREVRKLASGPKTGPATAEENQQNGTRDSEGGRPSESHESIEIQSSAASTKSAAQSQSTPSSQSLKLFPDNLPPRVSSKAAWRISGARPPASARGLPATHSPKSTLAAGNTKLKAFPKTQGLGTPIGKVPSTQSANRSLTTTPIHDKFPQHRSSRRPASLPLGAIHAFPLPAPMRPLPSLPEPVAGINPSHGALVPANRPVTSTKRRLGLQPPFNSLDDIVDPDPRESHRPAMSTKPGTPSKAVDGKQPDTISKEKAPQANEPTQSGITPFVRTGQSRADRVRALKMKDISASRIYLTGADNEPNGEVDQPPGSPTLRSVSRGIEEVPDTGSQDDGPPKLAAPLVPSPLSPPSLLLHHRSSDPQIKGKRSCSSPIRSRSAVPGPDDLSSLPTSSRSSHISRCSSSRSSDAMADRGLSVPDHHTRVETPIPSSDDECTSRSKLRHPPPPVSKRRRQKLAPIVVGDAGARKTRSSKKHCLRADHGPTTPRRVRSRGFDRLSPDSPHSHSTYISHDSHGSYHHRPRSYVVELEGRISHLERQNKILQAALLAALDLGDKPGLETLLGGSTSSLSTPNTGRSFSSTTQASSVDEPPMRDERYTTRGNPSRTPYQPQNWIASPGSSRRGSYSTEDSDHVRELEDMIEDFDFNWPSEKFSLEKPLRVGFRA